MPSPLVRPSLSPTAVCEEHGLYCVVGKGSQGRMKGQDSERQNPHFRLTHTTPNLVLYFDFSDPRHSQPD